MTAWEVANVDEAVKALREKGVRLVNADAESRATGANVFIHPKSAHGVIIELLKKEK